IFPAGPPVRHPSELLSSERFVEFLQTLATMYDYVLVDSPPVGAVTDASVLASQVDGVLFVVNYKFRTRRPAHGALKTLEQVGANVLGIVLNEVPAVRGASYGGYNAPVIGDA
ncbi:MAG: Tyrosine-protein kinase EpsD, partial [Thermoleophilia bacterium]|nr:Tyrosine-protein kinase EpsD [Thermoleophilia bacterium]